MLVLKSIAAIMCLDLKNQAMNCPKHFIRFTNAEGAGAHCETGAISLFDQRVFDWLGEVLGVSAI
jgi:hypothetical protein